MVVTIAITGVALLGALGLGIWLRASSVRRKRWRAERRLWAGRVTKATAPRPRWIRLM
jgi:hypothetical protein